MKMIHTHTRTDCVGRDYTFRLQEESTEWRRRTNITAQMIITQENHFYEDVLKQIRSKLIALLFRLLWLNAAM